MIDFIACLTAVLSAVAVRVARTVALKRALLDVPNERSSHKVPVPRLGGAAFIPVVLFGVTVGWSQLSLPLLTKTGFLLPALALFAVSLTDDFVSLSTVTRFAVQFAAVAGAVWAAVLTRSLPYGAGVSLVAAAALIVAIVGLLNIYNFMDGIDGIAGLQSIVGGIAWFAIGGALSAPGTALLGAVVAAGAAGFLTLNWPPARIFMGDAGSTVLGYTFGVMPLLVWAEASVPVSFVELLGVAGLIVWPFLADGAFTILRRARKRENIFRAHRSHLYQRLVIAGETHRLVSLVYGGMAAVGAILGWYIIAGRIYTKELAVVSVVLGFGSLWIWTQRAERNRSREMDGS